jgi:EAL domain-containing protein (putative c-di-GMP-specific phosphodiesterase class I)
VADLSATDRRGHALRVAVNVSMHNLLSVGFADYVAAETERCGTNPDRLTLEVTESELMRDCRVPLEVLTRLRMKRFGLSIDDFGTGHSSLAQLRDIPFNELKIDRGFVHEAASNPTLKAIFDNTLRLARELDISVVAEGVEDLADWEFVRNSDCELAQGYYFARPMPADELLAWLQGWPEGVA